MPEKQMAIQRAQRTDGATQTRPIMLAIAGDSASGKTTLTKGLVDALGAERITSMCVDDYHRYDRQERKGLPFTPLHPDCNYVEIMEQHLRLLSMGEPILKPVYNHANGALERPMLVEPREFIIVEGLLPLFTKVTQACFDVTVYLDPPEEIRIAWKVKRDMNKRGYAEEEVREELKRREPESEQFIRPQRRNADVVVRFSPIEERGESPSDPPSATLLLRPTIPHPDLSKIVGENTREAMHLKLIRDEDGKPVDAFHIHAYGPKPVTEKAKEAIWAELGVPEPMPEVLGTIEPGARSEPLAVTQLILLFHLVQARALHGKEA